MNTYNNGAYKQIGGVMAQYASVSTTSASVWSPIQGVSYSYFHQLNANTTSNSGSLGGFIPAQGVNGTLGAFPASGTESIQQDLFYWSTPGTKVVGNTSNVLITTTLDASGNIVTAVATPIPPSALLFAAGFLGFFGIKRRNFFNS